MHGHMNVKSIVLVTLCILMLRSDSHDNIMNKVLWNVMPCSLVDGEQSFSVTCGVIRTF